MAELPDLDTTQIGYLAYWNVFDDGGATDFDPENALSDPRINQSTLFDNGFDAEYTAPNGRDPIFVRVKSDGWFVAWLNRDEAFTENTSDSNRNTATIGHYDIIHNWPARNGLSNLEANTLARSIQNLQAELDVTPAFDFADVGLFNFAFDTADASTMLGSQDSGISGRNTYGFVYTAATTPLYAAITAETDGNAETFWNNNIDTGDVTISFGTGSIGSRDILGDIPDAEFEYNMHLETDTGTANQAQGAIVVIWTE